MGDKGLVSKQALTRGRFSCLQNMCRTAEIRGWCDY